MLRQQECSRCTSKLTYNSFDLGLLRYKCDECGNEGALFGHHSFKEVQRSRISNDLNDISRVFGAYVFDDHQGSLFIVREWYKHQQVFSFFRLTFFLYIPILAGIYVLSTPTNAAPIFINLFKTGLFIYLVIVYLELLNRFNITRIFIADNEVLTTRGPLPFILPKTSYHKIQGIKDFEVIKHYKFLSLLNGYDLILVDNNGKKHKLFKRVQNEKQITQTAIFL